MGVSYRIVHVVGILFDPTIEHIEGYFGSDFLEEENIQRIGVRAGLRSDTIQPYSDNYYVEDPNWIIGKKYISKKLIIVFFIN